MWGEVSCLCEVGVWGTGVRRYVLARIYALSNGMEKAEERQMEKLVKYSRHSWPPLN
ncbi:hypothetical protein [Robertkochia flava]|uniref:hypothetical protein n=1 Tax=Robertkochia flava TaxID=3447986 RepID=UPI001CCCA55F|nr:hypothetical protein [Robertkochia marina]